jgi:ABC-2 type transport system permease protein
VRRAVFLPLAAGLLLAAFAGLSLAAGTLLPGVRIDASADRLFTLSGTSRAVARSLRQTVTIELFVAREAAAADPAIRAHAQQVRDLLRAYAGAGQGRIRISEQDAAPFSAAEDQALAAGLTAVTVGDGGNAPPLYLGAVLRSSVDGQIVLPFLSPDGAAHLEYDITRALAELSGAPRQGVTVISSLPWMFAPGPTGPQPVAGVARALAQSADVVVLPEDFTALPTGTGVILLVQPWPLTPWQQWVLDQHVLADGRVIAVLDPASTTAADGNGGEVDATGNLGALAPAWGFTVSPDVVLDRKNALRVRAEVGGRQTEVPQPLFFSIPSQSLSRTSPVTSALMRGINVGTPGAVEQMPGSGLGFETLATTSTDTMRMEAARALASPDPQDVLAGWQSDGERQTVAARLSGPLRSAFPQGAPPVPQTAAAGQGPLAGAPLRERTRPAQIVVLADTDVLNDGFYRSGETETADNAAFLLSALESMGGGSGLADVRARAATPRPLRLVDELNARAQEELVQEQQRLETRVLQAEQRIRELEARSAGAGLFGDGAGSEPTQAQTRELEAFRTELVESRRRLRAVQDGLRQDVARLKAMLIAVTCALVPGLALVGGLLLSASRTGRRRRAGVPA